MPTESRVRSIEEVLEENQDNYRPEAWKEYTEGELGMWTHLLRKRATHRTNKKKRDKDIKDADNYETMLRVKITRKDIEGF